MGRLAPEEFFSTAARAIRFVSYSQIFWKPGCGLSDPPVRSSLGRAVQIQTKQNNDGGRKFAGRFLVAVDRRFSHPKLAVSNKKT